MASNNETVSRQISEEQRSTKSMTSAGNNTKLPVNVDRRLPLQRGLMNSQVQISSYIHCIKTLIFIKPLVISTL